MTDHITEEPTVLMRRVGSIAIIRMNRPKSLNALDFAMAKALDLAVKQVAAQADVKVLIINGAGRAFMGGGDLNVLGLRSLPIPVVASTQGAIAGGGLGLAMAADLVVAADDSKFVIGYGAIGTSPDGGTSWSLTQLLGIRRAMDILMLGDPVDALSALSLGMVNKVVARADLEAETLKYAQRLAKGASGAIAKAKSLVYAAATSPMGPHLKREHAGFVASAGTADFREGIEAFFERRPALFQGE